MLETHCILLASHGTRGALAAAQTSIALGKAGNELHHLVVVPELWKGMTGDDWLNNGSTRDTYRRYLESELGREIDEHCAHIQQQAAAKGLSYQRAIVVGEPDTCLIAHSQGHNYDLVVMGSPRPKGEPGLRSRMKTESLAKGLRVPLLIVPFPNGPD